MVDARAAHSGAILTQWPHQDVENWPKEAFNTNISMSSNRITFKKRLEEPSSNSPCQNSHSHYENMFKQTNPEVTYNIRSIQIYRSSTLDCILNRCLCSRWRFLLSLVPSSISFPSQIQINHKTFASSISLFAASEAIRSASFFASSGLAETLDPVSCRKLFNLYIGLSTYFSVKNLML